MLLNKEPTCIEDCLEILTGFRTYGDQEFFIDTNDGTILYSISKQIARGLALTDRQRDLVVEKLKGYKDQFDKAEIPLNMCLNNLRQPLREIDRSTYIKTVEHKNEKYICIRFPFNKKTIMLIEELRIKTPSSEYVHERGKHTHLFRLNEVNIYAVLEKFSNKNYEIEQELVDCYGILMEMKNNKEKYVPGIYGLKLKNMPQEAMNIIVSDIGEPTIENLAILKDKEEMYGLDHFDAADLEKSISQLTSLSAKVVKRKSNHIHIDPKEWNLKDVFAMLLELQRFPVQIILKNNDEYKNLSQSHRCLKYIIDDSDIGVMFRLDNNNENNISFNQYIKNNNLNSPVAISQKVVYTNTSKITKPLIDSGWQPKAILRLGSENTSMEVSGFVNDCDLDIHYDVDVSPYLNTSFRGRSQGRIEKI